MKLILLCRVLKNTVLSLNLIEANIRVILSFVCRFCQDISLSFPLQNTFIPLNNLKDQVLSQNFPHSFSLFSLMCALQVDSLLQCLEIFSFWSYTVMYISNSSCFWMQTDIGRKPGDH